MTLHQDNAARLARLAQIIAIVGAIAAVFTFIIPIPAQRIDTTPRQRSGGLNDTLGAATTGKPRFEVPDEDWTVALAPLNASRDPIAEPESGPGLSSLTPEDTTPTDIDDPVIGTALRPPIRYLGPLKDSKGFAALIDFAGKQRLLRIGQEFEDEFEITEITEDSITVIDGLSEYTFELAQSNLTNVLPNSLLNLNRRNPNAFPPGRAQPGQPQRPGDREANPRKPVPQNDEEGGSPT